MQRMSSIVSTRQQIFTAVQSNTKHQYALEKYSQRLTAELQEIDKLLAAADIGDSDDEHSGDVEIQGASRAVGPMPGHEFLNPVSPFYSEAIKRSRYCNTTMTHGMRPKELDTLTEAVTAEFRRLRVLEGQGRGSNVVDLTANVDKLNWETIAEKVSDVSSFTRSDHECKTKWLGHHRPGICHDGWSTDELKQLKEIVAEKEKDEEYELDWVEVASELGTNRTAIDCMRHGLKRISHTWTSEADKKLLEAVQVYGTENWALVALHVSPNVASIQCQMRFTRTLDPSLNRSPWSGAEDERLNKIVSAIGASNWPEVARHMPGRTNEMCRERYLEGNKTGNKVKGKGKGKAKAKTDDHNEKTVEETEGKQMTEVIPRSEWTRQKDEELVRLVGEMGNKWQKISTAMGGMHTNVQCRLRYKKLKNSIDPHSAATTSDISLNSDPGFTALEHPLDPPPRPGSNPNTYLSFAPSGSGSNLNPLQSDSHLSISQSMPTSSSQSGSANVHGAPASMVQVKPRPKAKPNRLSTSNSEAPETDKSNKIEEERLFSSNSASHPTAGAPSAAASITSTIQNRPSRRGTFILSAAILEELESLEPARDATFVPSTGSNGQPAGWDAGIHVIGWQAEGPVRGWEGEVQTEGQVRGWEASTSLGAPRNINIDHPPQHPGAAMNRTLAIGSSEDVVRNDSSTSATTSARNSNPGRKESRRLFSPSSSSPAQNDNSGGPITSSEHGSAATSTRGRAPARRKGRTRKSTTDKSAITLSNDGSLSTPGSSSTLRRSSRLHLR